VLEKDLEGLQSQQSVPGYRKPRSTSSYGTGGNKARKTIKVKSKAGRLNLEQHNQYDDGDRK